MPKIIRPERFQIQFELKTHGKINPGSSKSRSQRMINETPKPNHTEQIHEFIETVVTQGLKMQTCLERRELTQGWHPRHTKIKAWKKTSHTKLSIFFHLKNGKNLQHLNQMILSQRLPNHNLTYTRMHFSDQTMLLQHFSTNSDMRTLPIKSNLSVRICDFRVEQN